MPGKTIDIRFHKMSGAGNDFILVDARPMKEQIAWDEATRRLCDRRYGVGADGLLVIAPGSRASFTMLYFNADGSSGGMCGNGGRCAARYVFDSAGGTTVSFEALGHIYTASALTDGDVSLMMTDPRDFRELNDLKVAGTSLRVHYVDTGAPHAVLLMGEQPESIRAAVACDGVHALGRTIRYHREFSPSGTNVDFVDMRGNGVGLRTYERGVEAETLACGTGSIAAAIISALRLDLGSPVQVHTLSGEVLSVAFERVGNEFTHITLTGPAREVFAGTMKLNLSKPFKRSSM